MSQKRSDLKVISNYSGLEDLLLRPLSAKLLEPIKPERDGLVDREKLYDFQGRSRKGLIALAREFGFTEDMIPTPSTGCSLTEPGFGSKVHDLIQIQVDDTRWDYEILKLGRHFRWDEATKVILGRDEQENDRLEYIHVMPEATSTAILEPASFTGPSALITGPATSEAIEYAVGLVCRYGRSVDGAENRVQVSTADKTYDVVASDNRRAAEDQTIASMLIR
jgi:hypothetical protein